MKTEDKLYPTDILRSKYVTVLEASRLCGVIIPDILEMIRAKEIPYAEFTVEGVRKRVTHVNPEDVRRVLDARVVEK